MYSKTVLIGNVGSDIELKSTPSGKSVCSFSIATSTRKDVTDWHNIVAWEKTAELISRYVGKGGKIMVEGENKTRSYEKNGTKMYSTEIVAYKVVFLDKKGERGTQEASIDDVNIGDVPF